MGNDSYFRFDDVKILTIIAREMSELETKSSVYSTKRDWENWLNLRMYFNW